MFSRQQRRTNLVFFEILSTYIPVSLYCTQYHFSGLGLLSDFFIYFAKLWEVVDSLAHTLTEHLFATLA